MFCAVELRQLEMGGERPPGPFAVLKDGRVFDASLTLWELGVDWGMEARELGWRAPAAARCWWDGPSAVQAERALAAVLESWGTGFQVLDGRRGVVEWPHPLPDDWRALVRALVPARAAGLRGGLAPHPLLARWVARAGAALRLPAWDIAGTRLFVCEGAAVRQAWDSLPLSATPLPAAELRRWQRAGIRRAGEVPGLVRRLMRLGLGETERRQHFRAERRFPEALAVGTAEVLEELARELAGQLTREGCAAQGLILTWESESGAPIRRERRWPEASQSGRILSLRALGLMQPWPADPPITLSLEALDPEPAVPQQLIWWPGSAAASQAHRPDLAGAWGRVGLSLREQRLAFWDPWRAGRAGP
jgi:hypothetical protein